MLPVPYLFYDRRSSDLIILCFVMPALGLDVGSSAIKLIELSGKIKSPQVTSFGLAVNPVGNLETENQQEQVSIATAIKKLVQDSGVKNRKVVVALPESKVFTRVVEMPILSDSELASAINWEAEQYIPIPISEVQLDYRILSKPTVMETNAKMQIFLVAAPTVLINKLSGLMELAGLEIEAVETEILGLARAFEKLAINKTILLVHLGAASTDLCIMESNVIVFTRSMPTGGLALSRTLASDLGLEVAQAEQYKRTYGLDQRQLQGKVTNALLPVVNTLSEEMRKAIQFYTTNKTGKINQVILSGGGAYLPQLTGELAKALGIEVLVGDPFLGMTMDDQQRKRIGGIASVFSVAVGLAMRGLE